jgi:hypothetical protein
VVNISEFYIQVPPDGSGKRVRTQATIKSGATVNIHYMIPCNEDGTVPTPYALDSSVNDPFMGKTILKTKVAYTASATGTAIAPTSGKKWVLLSALISHSADGTVWLYDYSDTGANAIGPTWSGKAGGGSVFVPQLPIPSGAINHYLWWGSGAGAAGSIWIEYYEV